MDYIKRIENIMSEQKGTLLSLDLDENKIPRTYLSIMMAAGKIERVGRGIYVLRDLLEDEMFILQKKYLKLIYSHETALFLHELSDRTPLEHSVTVPSGYKVINSVREKSKVYYVKRELHSMGMEEGKTSFGNIIRIYNVERTICDIIRSRNRIDVQLFSDGLKRGVRKRDLDYGLLMEYARKLNVEKLLSTYMEVLV